MGFFSKLFGGREESKPEAAQNLPVQSIELKGVAQLRLTEILQREHSGQFEQRMQSRADGSPDDQELVDSMKVRYAFDADYAVCDEAQFQDMIGDDDPVEALNELFYVCLSEVNSVTVKVIEGDTEDYAAQMLDAFNNACGDWGVKCRRLSVKSIAPADEYREFYEAYKAMWG